MALIFKVAIEKAEKPDHYKISWLDRQTSQGESFISARGDLGDEEIQFQWLEAKYQLDIGRKLFRFLDGDRRLLEGAVDQGRKKDQPVILHLYTCVEVENWPFELIAGGKGFLLVENDVHLVRCVSEWGKEKKHRPQNRSLKMMFMACSAMDIEPELDFEKEEEAIVMATEGLPLDLEVEDSGSLNGLGERLLHEKYDVVHLSGHADIKDGRPVFIMEDEYGYGDLVDAEELWHSALKSNPPSVLFLSGCRTGESPTSTKILGGSREPFYKRVPGPPEASNETMSFARSMLNFEKIPVVLGWGKPVGDEQAREAAKVFYRELSRGCRVMDALQQVRSELVLKYKDAPHPDWPLLRLFGSEMMLGALVTQGQRVLPKPRVLKHSYLKNSRVKILEEGFVGRRRQMQQGLRILKKDKDKVGVLLHGPGGLGKSCLAGKLCERFAGHFLIIVNGRFNAITLNMALKDAFIAAEDNKGKKILAQKKEMVERLAELCASSFKEKNYFILLDDFEQNQEGYEQGQPGVLTAEAAALLRTLLHYLPFSGKMTQVIITGRYLFTLTEQGVDLVQERLQAVSLTSFRAPERRKKAQELPHIMKYLETNVLLLLDFIRMGHGNPRLMEWIDKLVGEMAEAEVPDLLAAARGQQEEFIKAHVMRELVDRAGEQVKRFLISFCIYRRPVMKEGARSVAEATSLSGWDKLLKRSVTLSLAEYDGARDVYSVTEMLHEELEKGLPEQDIETCHRAAMEYYRVLCEGKEAIDPVLHEEWIYHALGCGEEDVASRQGGLLVGALYDRLAFLESVRVGEWVLREKKKECADEHDAFLLNNLGAAIDELGDKKKAISYYEQALAIDERVFGKEHPAVAVRLNNLGLAWSALGDKKKAISYYEAALAIDEQVYGKKHPAVARDLNNLGSAWKELGENKKAISYYEQALAIWKAVYRDNHPQVATAMSNLGSAWDDLGETKKAISYYEAALAIWKAVYGDTHPNVASALNNLGGAWRGLGEAKKAISYYEAALAIDEKVYGKEHPAVARDLNNLGSAWKELGNNKKAISYYEAALAIDERVFGKEHPAVARDLNNLGEAWRGLGEAKKAISYFEQALAIWKAVYGDNHPQVAVSLNNLGGAWSALGDKKKAISYFEAALAIWKSVYGDNHPQVAVNLNNLGGAWYALGEHNKAISYFEQALAIDEKVYGKEHPNVAIRLNNLGSAWSDLGDKKKAISYYEQALAIWKLVYGDNHPQVAVGLNNLGAAWSDLGEKKKAISYYEAALAKDEWVFGKEHPAVAGDLNNLGSAYFEMGDKKRAKGYFEMAYHIFKKFFGDEHPHTITVKRWLEKW